MEPQPSDDAPSVGGEQPAEQQAVATPEPEGITDGQPPVQAPVEPEAPVAPTIPEWNTLEDIGTALQDGTIPDNVLPWMQAVLPHVETFRQTALSAQEDYNSAKETFQSLASQLESAEPGQGVAVLTTQLEQNINAMETMSQEHIDVSWRAFGALHPEFAGLQKSDSPLIEVFSNVVQNDLYRLFPKGTLLDKMEKAYQYAAFQSGVNLNAPSPQPAQAAAPAPAPKPVNAQQDAPAQALVNDGATAMSQPAFDVDEASYDEILDRHDHLL